MYISSRRGWWALIRLSIFSVKYYSSQNFVIPISSTTLLIWTLKTSVIASTGVFNWPVSKYLLIPNHIIISKNWNQMSEFAGESIVTFGQLFFVTLMNWVSLSAILRISPSTRPECLFTNSEYELRGIW